MYPVMSPILLVSSEICIECAYVTDNEEEENGNETTVSESGHAKVMP